MADKTVMQENIALPLDGTEWVRIVQSLGSVRAQVSSFHKPVPINPQTGTAYTLALTDVSPLNGWAGLVTMNNAGASILTVPENAAVAFPAGVQIAVARLGAGSLTIVGGTITGGGTVAIRSASTLIARAQYSVMLLTYLGANTWLLSGDTQ